MFYVGEIILFAGNYAPVGFAKCHGQLMPIPEYETLFQLIGTTYGGDGQDTFALPDLRGRVPIHQGTGPSGTTYPMGEMAGVEGIILTQQQIPSHTHAIDLSTMTATARCWNGNANSTNPINAMAAVEAQGPYTDSTLTSGVTTAKAAHVTELRLRINGARAANGLPAATYSDPSLIPASTVVKAQHIIELRAAIAQVYTQLGLTQPAFSDPQLSAGTTLKAAHIQQLRAAVAALGPPATALRYSNLTPDANMHPSAIAVSGTPTAAQAGLTQPHTNMQPFLAINYCISLFGVFPSPT